LIEERAFWLAWSQINGIGPVLIKRLQQQFGSLKAAWLASASDLIGIEGFGLLTAESVVAQRQQLVPEILLQQHERENPQFWTPADAEYPRLLLEIADLPPVLYYRGNIDLKENQGLVPTIAIVGTREPTDYGKRWTRRICNTLAQQGFTIVSGLAEGIDTEVHRSCVAAQSRNIGVLGTGVDIVYPHSNRNLFRQVMEYGLLLSEYPAGTQPDRIHFPRRNRIIAGLSRAVIITEAPTKSGALITAQLANDYGRDVYVVPGSLDNSKALGGLRLLSQGAQVILNEAHLLEMLGALPQLTPLRQYEQTQLSLNLEPGLEQVLQILTNLMQQHNLDAVSFDLLVQESGLPASNVSSALLQLEVSGLIVQLPGMRYGRSK
jgi:DNA processing protein